MLPSGTEASRKEVVPYLCYIPKKFNPEHRAIIDMANHIIEEYSAQGFDLTLRQ